MKIQVSDVTELKRSEQEVNNGQLFSQIFIDALPGIFCRVDVNGKISVWNAYVRDKIIGKPETEIAGTDVASLVHPDERELFREKMLRVLNEDVEEYLEVKIPICGGPQFRWFLLKGKRIIIDSIPSLMGFGIDITERKQATDALEQSENKFRSITEQLDGQVFTCDTEGVLTYVSPATEKISGFMPDEMIGHRFTEFLAEREVATAIEGFFDTLSNTSLKKVFEHRLRRKNGSLFWGEVHVQKYQNKETSGTIGLLFDITRRKGYESLTVFRLRILQMAESHSVEELLRATLDEAEKLTGSAIGFCHFIENDPAISTLRVASSNIQKTMHGVERDVQHPSLTDVGFWADTIRNEHAVITNDYGSAKTQGNVLPHGHPEIRRTLVVPMLQGDKVMAILGVGNKLNEYDDDDVKLLRTLADIAWDIVARKRAEQYAQEMQTALTQSQKMELIGQLAGGIAHDFNNMLGVILGNIEIALDQKIAFQKPLQQNLQNILKAANRSADLTRQLLTFARKQTVMPIVLELNTLVENMLTVLRQLIGKNITINWIPDTARALIKADPSQIDQILINLCVNARDAISGTGQITIKIGELCEHKILHTPHQPCRVSGDYVTLSITDNGCGIEKELFPHIFEPFFTTKMPGKGTGLGLSTIYGIVKQSNGCIECISHPGNGTTFKVHLPRYMVGYTDPDENAQHLASNRTGQETILLVEDEPDILILCKFELEQTGYTVLTATTPQEALSLAEQYLGSIDLLLTDVVMPQMNGCDLAKKLLLVNSQLKVLFMSGYSCDVIVHNNLLDEGVNFIQKPFSLKLLAMMVQNLLTQS
jgi:two-component system cell cycle sensor histidine kinase/response regulator CckA